MDKYNIGTSFFSFGEYAKNSIHLSWDWYAIMQSSMLDEFTLYKHISLNSDTAPRIVYSILVW